MKKNLKNNSEAGITLFIALIILGTLLVVSTGIVNLATRQSFISSFANQSQQAFYAADSGIECAIFWDVRTTDPSLRSAFSPLSNYAITCNGQTTTPTKVTSGIYSTSTFSFNFSPEPSCVIVTVAKNSTSGATIVESKGYNTCGTSARKVERAVRAKY
jgi:Tfp pilus assembly protein PilX